MKIKLQLFVFLMAAKFISAQSPITVTSSNMPGSGDTIRYSSCRVTSIDTAFTGANVVWNYDTLQPLSQGVYSYLSSLQTAYAFYFLGLNYYGLKIADSLGFSPIKVYNVYNFYKSTTSSFSAVGLALTYSGFPLASKYTDKDELYSFPLDYLDHDSTTFKDTMKLGSNLYYATVGYRINDVDGWGVIKTPYDSVACLRLVSTSYGKDSINFNGFPINFPNVQRSYKWMSVTEKIPVLEINGTYNSGTGAFTPLQARYRDQYRNLVGMNEIEKPNSVTKVFPNPASNEIFVLTTNAASTVVNFYDLTGSLVLSQQISAGAASVSTRSFANGCYFYSVLNKKGEQLSAGKIVVEK